VFVRIYTVYHPVFLLLNDQTKDVVIARSEQNQLGTQITNPKYPYWTFINFETHFSQIYTVPLVKIIFNWFLEAHSIKE
jgi:hypothetical protein